MTIDELIERLENYRDEIGGDAEVRLMTQQNWPFENKICGLASGQEINDSGDEDDPDDDGVVEHDQVLYIVFSFLSLKSSAHPSGGIKVSVIGLAPFVLFRLCFDFV